MKTVILGCGKSGQAARNYLRKKNIPTLCVDQKPSLPDVISDQTPPDLSDVDCVIKSPGILLSHPWVVAARAAKIKVIGEIDLALAHLQHKIVLAVTGSNGKTTTVLALQHVLGTRAVVAGNIGTPLLSIIDTPAEIVIVELSSFQLETIEPKALFDAAVILNITPNHLDHHPTFEDYVQAKWRIKECLKPKAPLFCQKDWASYKEKVETIFSSRYRDGQCGALMEHDRENFAAVYALCQEVGVSDEVFEERILTFKKPAHRIEFVREMQQTLYFNDSKATSVDAVLKAVSAMTRPVILIAGGVDKGGAFHDWLPVFSNKVKQVFAIGQAAQRIHCELHPTIAVSMEDSMEEAVRKAYQQAKPGDCVLLSPGCSSFDQFQSYEARGEAFKKYVHALGS